MGMRARLTILAALGLMLAACATGNVPEKPTRVSNTLPPAAISGAHGSDASTRAILNTVNIYRGEHGIPPLSGNAELQRAAAIHSADMAQRHFAGHFNPEGQGPNERLLAVWPEFKGTYAENIAVLGNVSGLSPEGLAKACMKLWIASPGHRKNIRSEDYTLSDVGIAHDGDKVYVTELFARP
jgi:uncharacterized protein YkwD